MTSLPPPKTKSFKEDSLEKKVYNLVESFKDNIPIINDRNRLGFNLYKYMSGEGDHPEVLVKSTKIELKGISKEDLAQKLNDSLNLIRK